jgi:Sodium:sulfate symporter transmembrane region
VDLRLGHPLWVRARRQRLRPQGRRHGGADAGRWGDQDRAGTAGAAQAAEPERRPTYKTLDEQQGRLTEAEERFERGRRTIGLFLGPLVFLLLLALPLDLDGKQQGLAAVLGLVVVWWITEAIPIPITGVVGLCLCVILNVASADDVFGSVFDSTILLFIGSFIIARRFIIAGTTVQRPAPPVVPRGGQQRPDHRPRWACAGRSRGSGAVRVAPWRRTRPAWSCRHLGRSRTGPAAT